MRDGGGSFSSYVGGSELDGTFCDQAGEFNFLGSYSTELEAKLRAGSEQVEPVAEGGESEEWRRAERARTAETASRWFSGSGPGRPPRPPPLGAYRPCGVVWSCGASWTPPVASANALRPLRRTERSRPSGRWRWRVCHPAAATGRPDGRSAWWGSPSPRSTARWSGPTQLEGTS